MAVSTFLNFGTLGPWVRSNGFMEMGVSFGWFLHAVDPRKAGLNCRAFSGSLGWWDVTDIVMSAGIPY